MAPLPDAAIEAPFQTPRNILLDDVLKELVALRYGILTLEHRAGHTQFNPIPVMHDIMRLLGCLDCKRF